MALFHNLDRVDAAINTKYPFRWDCKLDLGGEFPVREIVSLRVQSLENDLPPFRIGRFVVDDDKDEMQWSIYDDTGRDCLRIMLPLHAAETMLYPVLDLDGCLSGHFICTPALIGTVVTLIRSAGGTVVANRNDFVLAPACHVPILSGVFKVVSVNGQNTREPLLSTGDNVMLKRFRPDNDAEETASPANGTNELPGGVFRLHAVSDYRELSENDAFTKLAINGALTVNGNPATTYDKTPDGGFHLFLTHELASNLRVTVEAEPKQLHFFGVQDV